MPSVVDTKLTPDLYGVFLSYKRATTKAERWLAVTSNKGSPKVRLTISEMQQAAQYIKSKRIEVPDLIYYAFDRAITARSQVTSHFRGFFATRTTEAKNSSHENFTKILKAIFKSLCPNRPSSSLAKATSSSSTPASNFFETLSSLPSEIDARSANVDEDTEADEANYGRSHTNQDEVDDEGIKNDVVVEDLELHFALWDLETTCAKVRSYWTQAAVGKMPVMLSGFLTNAAVANIAFRFRKGQRFFDTSKMISYEKVFEWFNSPTLGILEISGAPDSVVTEDFKYEMLAPFIAIILCQQGLTGHAHNALEDMIGKPQDYITPIEGARDYTGRVTAEVRVLDSLLTSIKRFPRCPGSRHHDYVMGFHPFIIMPDLHNFVGPIPTSATFVLRLMVESYKSWYTLPAGMQRVPDAHLRLHALTFAQKVHKTVVRFRLSEPYEPIVGCECSDCCDPGLMEDLRMFESELSTFISDKKFDLYHQSPVVAGYQMTRILARATVLGILFCNIWQYVGVVLHLYNFLRQYDLIDEEKVLLEHICDVMGHNIFRGPRPTLKFYSHYAAFQAMTLKFNHKSRTFAFGESNIHRRQFDSHSLSVMTGLNECGCQPYCNRWGPVWRGVDKRSRVTNEGIFKTVHQITSHPLVCVLEPLESVVRPEWEGKFPVARINWFEVFTACTDVLEKMPAVHCEDPKDLTSRHFHHTRDDGFYYGIDNVERLLSKAQQLEKGAFKIACAERVRLAQDAICETFKGSKSDDFLWDL